MEIDKPATIVITGVRPIDVSNRRTALETISTSKNRPPEFPRAPREYIPYPDEEISIMLPSAPPSAPTNSIFATLLPVLGVLMMVSFGIYAANATAQGQTGGIPIFALMSLPMALVSVVGGLAKYWSDNKKYKKELEIRKAKYEEYLSSITAKLVNLSQAQREASLAAHSSLVTCQQIVQQRIPTKLWARENGDPDFLEIRLGIGETSSTFQVTIPNQTQFQILTDPLEEKARAIVPRFSKINNMVVALPLLQIGAAGWIGKSINLVKTVRSALLHLATHHAPSEVKIVVLSSEEEANEWEWVRWLPHNWSDGREKRFFANNKPTQAIVMGQLENILKQRANQQVLQKDTEGLQIPVYVVVVADINIWRGPQSIKFTPILELLLKDGPKLGAFPIFLAGKISRVPKACKAVVNLENTPATLKLLGTTPKNLNFVPDVVELYQAWLFAQAMAPIRLEETGGGASNLPGTVRLTELIGAPRIEEINVLEIWNQSNPFDTLAVPIGIGAGGKRLLLDLHEKSHGPHGLVAGTTGSGKTALLSTYLALAALHYHPHELGFIGIDFKGGDLIRELKDIPHMIGTMTNLDGSGPDRAIKILRGEIKKRQNRFNQAGIGNIYDYQKMYRKGDSDAPLPMPHLVIVCDEFAELKKEHPEFIRELVSISRVGRSLGIHLILATQKPAGVVSDEIWANSHFHLCLKVASLEDSREMLRRNEAAEITQKGRAYFQVGMNEVFELFQAAWGDAPYIPHDTTTQDVRISRVGVDGAREEIWPPRSVATGTGKTQIQELAARIIQVCAENGIRRLDDIWPPDLSEQIDKTLGQILLDTGWDGVTWSQNVQQVAPVLGIIDNPDQQRQEILRINLEASGHLAIFGSSGSGKTTAIQTLVTSMCSELTPERVHIYLLDYAGRNLSVFERMPHVGAVISNGENERLKRFFMFLGEEIERRKKMIEMDQTMNAFRANHPDRVVAEIVVVLDGYSHFAESFKLQTYTTEVDNIIRIASQGGNLGIHLIVGTDQVKSFPTKLLGNIKEVVCTELNDQSDYSSVIGRTGGLFPPKDRPGRGLIKQVPVKEFQATLPAESPLELKLLAEKMDQSWHGERARQVPVLPEILSISDLPAITQKKYPQKLGLTVPLALDLSKPDLPPFNLSLESNAHFWLSGLAQSGKTSLLQTWLLSLAEAYSPQLFRFYLVDLSWGNLEALKVLPHSIGCINDAVEFKSLDIKEQLADYLNIDFSLQKPFAIEDLEKPEVVLAVDGMGALQKGLAGDKNAEKNRDFLLSLLRVKNARFHTLISGLPVEFGGGMTMNPIGETLRGLQRGVWLGDGTNGEVSSFNFQFTPGETIKGLTKGVAFSVNRGKYTTIKLASCHVGIPSMEDRIQNIISGK